MREIRSMREDWAPAVAGAQRSLEDAAAQLNQMAAAIQAAQISPAVADVFRQIAIWTTAAVKSVGEGDRLCRSIHRDGFAHAEQVKGVAGDPGVWGR